MTSGYLMHAYNNEELDYGTMALCSALLIKKRSKANNIALVTTQDTIDWLTSSRGYELVNSAFDHVVIIDIDRNVPSRTFHDTRYTSKIQPYYNTSRPDSFDLTPFDETILIDVDYLVLDDSLDNAWGSIEDIMVNKSVIDLNHTANISGFDSRLSVLGVPMYWATVMYFKKNARARVLFDLIKFIKENYKFYKGVYQFADSGYFRNDYALSIALHMLSGEFENDSIKSLPCPSLLFSTENDDMIAFNNGIASFISEPTQGNFSMHRINTNVHVMNKWSIVRMADRIIDYATR
jgi:hypothetical protein